MKPPEASGPALVGVCLGLLRVEWGRVGNGTNDERSGVRMGRPIPSNTRNTCIMASRILGTPVGQWGVADSK